MSQTSRLIDRRLAKALVFLQACMIPVSALVAWSIKDMTAALSADAVDWSAGLLRAILRGNPSELQVREHLNKCCLTCIGAC